MSVPVQPQRRRLLVSGALGLLVAEAVPGGQLPAFAGDYLVQLRQAIGIPAATDACADRIRHCMQADPAVYGFAAQGAARLQAAIGEQWQTAEHTIPSLVDEDLRLGRAVVVGGLLLTPIELALLVG